MNEEDVDDDEMKESHNKRSESINYSRSCNNEPDKEGYAVPVKGITGSILTRLNARQTRHLEYAAVEALKIAASDNILEIGYGRGDGIGYAYEKIKSGDGMIFCTDRSRYMEEVVRNRFYVEIVEEGKIRLDRAIHLSNLPYPSDFFSGIFHVDTYYFWGNQMRDICWDLCRVLKPGGRIVCALQLSRLRKLEEWHLISERLYNPMRYLSVLELSGFINVKMTYHKCPHGTGDEYQLIEAEKPQADERYLDADERMKQLETNIKREMLAMRILKQQRPQSAQNTEVFESEDSSQSSPKDKHTKA
ncbi:unnamed protein product [Anisakis simplex]|uniref:Methyltransferase domain-containing protein n=1 Tax=Anisakis simplex TaxID=6269 RepID=A0A3P6RPJ6_ANISI|nr:unnamed protein product [Anisakis simplex]